MNLKISKLRWASPPRTSPTYQVGAGLRTFEGQDGAHKNPLKSPSGVRLKERPQHLAVTCLGAHGPGRQLATLKNVRTSQ